MLKINYLKAIQGITKISQKGFSVLKQMNTFWTIENGNETYIYHLGKLIHENCNNNSEIGVTLDIIPYRKK